jgi:hypothetical protein
MVGKKGREIGFLEVETGEKTNEYMRISCLIRL